MGPPPSLCTHIFLGSEELVIVISRAFTSAIILSTTTGPSAPHIIFIFSFATMMQACRLLSKRTCATSSLSFCSARAMSSTAGNMGARSGPFAVTQAAPLADNHHTAWPAEADKPMPAEVEPEPRTIPDDKMNFQMRATFSHGSSIFYPHLKHHPADYKVGLVVRSSLRSPLLGFCLTFPSLSPVFDFPH